MGKNLQLNNIEKEFNMQQLIYRFKEPSSYSAIAAVLAMVGVIIPSDLWQSLVMVGCGIAGAAGFWIREKK